MVSESKEKTFLEEILKLSDQTFVISNKDYRANRIIIISTSGGINPLRERMAKSQQLFVILPHEHHLNSRSTS